MMPATAAQQAEPVDLLSAFGPARSTIKGNPLSPEEVARMDAYFRASLYLCVGMIYLRSNPLLRKPLTVEDVKQRLLGHWGSDPGMSFMYLHLNRLIKKYDLNAIFIAGPGHGAPAVLSPVLLSRRNWQPLHARNARLHPGGRRIRLQPFACLRQRTRSSRLDHLCGRGGWRSGNRAPCCGLALE